MCHKAVVEFLERAMYKRFSENMVGLTEEAKTCLQQMCSSANGHTLATVMANDDIRDHLNDYMEFRKQLLEGSLGSTAKMWVSYADNVWLILQLIEAVKRINYDTYLVCTKRMPDLFFVMDMQNYSRFLTYEGESLSNIESNHPGAEPLLHNGAICAAVLYTR